MAIPIVDLRAQHETIREETLAAVRRVLDSQRFVLGPEVEALEAALARLAGAAHAVGCASGSDAIMLAVAALQDPEDLRLRSARGAGASIPPLVSALGPGPARRSAASGAAGAHGEAPEPRAAASAAAAAAALPRAAPEVITTPFTFFASAGSVVHAGARPRFVDIEAQGFGMDPRLLPSAITPQTLAVLPVHLFGQPCDLDEIMRAAGPLPVIEDAAQAIGATYGPPGRIQVAGAIGRLGCLSFFPTKNLGGAGDGGMILTSDDGLAERLRKIRVHGGLQLYRHETVGWNSRLDEIQAAVLNVKVSRLAAWSRARAERARRYDALLHEAGLVSRGLVLPPVRRPDRTHIFHQYVVRVPAAAGGRGREGLREHLSAMEIGTGVYYPVPLHLQPCFRELGHARGDFPVSERAAEEVLALPIYPELTADQQARVVGEAASYFGLA